MIVKTETGSEYYIRNGILTKAGDNILAYKVSGTIPFKHGITDTELAKLPYAKPEVGKRLYIQGLGTWNITTNVVEVIEEEND